MRIARRSLASAAALALAALVVAPASPAAAQSATPAGGFADADGVIVDLTALAGAIPVRQTIVSSSQSCPPQVPEPDRRALLDVNVPNVARANNVVSMTGANCAGSPVAVASAQTEDVGILPQGPTAIPLIEADVLRAQANSDCTTAPNAVGTVIDNLRVGTTNVGANPPPNTTIRIPGLATVIVNEQRPTADGRGIVVNAVHVIGESAALRGDLIISHAVSGVVCPNGRGSEIATGLQAPAITFDKDANPSTARGGDTVTYTATVTNTSPDVPCDVISFVDHLSPGFEFVSTAGPLGDVVVTPVPARADGGQDVIIRPRGVTIAPGGNITQTIVVRLAADIAPATYFNTLEIFCNRNGNFASGPIAPVTVPAAAPAAPAPAPPAPAPAPEELPRTGVVPLIALSALLLLGGGLGARRFSRH